MNIRSLRIMAAPAKHSVKLYYDVISPFSYIAFEVLLRYSKRWENMDLKLQPVWIAGIMDAVGNTPPGALPARGRYLNQDLNRLFKFYKIPFNLPSDVPKVMFEKGSLPCQRLLVAIARDCPQYLEPVSRQLYLRIWYKDLDAIANESLAEACKDAGMPEDSIAKSVNSLSTPEIKSKLKEATMEAVDDGAFGLPAYVANINGVDFRPSNIKRLRKQGRTAKLRTENGKIQIIRRMMKGVIPRKLTH